MKIDSPNDQDDPTMDEPDRDIWFIFDNGGGVTVYDRGAGYAHGYTSDRDRFSGDSRTGAQGAAADAARLVMYPSEDCGAWDGNEIDGEHDRDPDFLSVAELMDHPSSASVAIDDLGAWLETAETGASFADQFGGGDVAEAFAVALRKGAKS